MHASNPMHRRQEQCLCVELCHLSQPLNQRDSYASLLGTACQVFQRLQKDFLALLSTMLKIIRDSQYSCNHPATKGGNQAFSHGHSLIRKRFRSRNIVRQITGDP
jgi:hypothetical protein